MQKSNPRFLNGLDSIRFVCALWVAIGHIGLPALPLLQIPVVGFVAHGAYANLVNGPAAVIVFFVVSGLCIHYPSSGTLRIASVGQFYLRRYVRIVLPILVAMLLARWLFGYRLLLFEDSILWSLLAELVYYSIYPLLLLARRQLGSWVPLIVIAYFAAFALAATDPAAGNYPSFGREFTWLLGLPCWLLGCQLAELVGRDRPAPATRTIWAWRLAILLLSMIASVLRFHSPIGYPWSLNIFALPVIAWLLLEIRYFRHHRPSTILEWGGAWSYSLYLSHMAVLTGLSNVALAQGDGLGDTAMKLAAVLVFAYAFFLLVEQPSHKLARHLAKMRQGFKERASPA